MSEEWVDDLTVNDGQAVLTSVAYSPYFPLRPAELATKALNTLRYRLDQRGFHVGREITFRQLDDPAVEVEHAFDAGWVTGPWYHRYQITAPVTPMPRPEPEVTP